MTNANEKYTPHHVESILIDEMSGEFEDGVKTLMDYLNKAKEALTKDPSNPSILADYQSKLQAYILFRNAQTSTIKAYKDIGATIIQNFR